MNKIFFLIFLISLISCKEKKEDSSIPLDFPEANPIGYAKGFSLKKSNSGLTIIKVASPWPNAETAFTYALIPKDKLATMTLDKEAYDAIVTVPVERIVVTSTTHIPALEALGVGDRLVGFPDTEYVSSKATRKRINAGQVLELGNNQNINTEMVLSLNPDVLVGFGVDGQNKAYTTLQKANIPVVYNGDWNEETPLGKAEWIKFFAPFFNKEFKADSIFRGIESAYIAAKNLAKTAKKKPSVLSGGLYKDVWYLPGGDSWSAQFLIDANAAYLWHGTPGTGSLSLSVESVLDKGKQAEFWVSPAQFTSYASLEEANRHYSQFTAFKNRNIYTTSGTTGETGGLLFYELAPQRPDLVLKDLIHILHPELLPKYEPFFYKPLD